MKDIEGKSEAHIFEIFHKISINVFGLLILIRNDSDRRDRYIYIYVRKSVDVYAFMQNLDKQKSKVCA